MSILDIIKEYWEFLLAIVTAVGGWIGKSQLNKWKGKREENKFLLEEKDVKLKLMETIRELMKEIDTLYDQQVSNQKKIADVQHVCMSLKSENEQMKNRLEKSKIKIQWLEENCDCNESESN